MFGRAFSCAAVLLSVLAIAGPAHAGPQRSWLTTFPANGPCRATGVADAVDEGSGLVVGVYRDDLCSAHTLVVGYTSTGRALWSVENRTHDDRPVDVVVSRMWHAVIVASTRDNDEMLVQAYNDRNGNLLWGKGLIATGNASFETVGLAIDGDDRVIVSGTVTRAGISSLSTAAFDVPNGGLLWHVHYSGASGLGAEATAIATDPRPERACIVGTASTGSGQNLLTLAYDTTTGQVAWQHEVAHVFPEPAGIAVDIHTHDIAVLTGNATDTGAFTYDFSRTGQVRWHSAFRGHGTLPRDIRIDSTIGQYYVLGEQLSPNRTTVVAYSTQGTRLWAHTDHANPVVPQGIAVDGTNHRVYATSVIVPDGSGDQTLTFALSQGGASLWRDVIASAQPPHVTPRAITVDPGHGQVYVAGDEDDPVDVLMIAFQV